MHLDTWKEIGASNIAESKQHLRVSSFEKKNWIIEIGYFVWSFYTDF